LGAKRVFSLSAPVAIAILRRTITATRLIYFLYQLLEIALSPVVAFYLLYRGIRDPKYFRGLGERLGFLPKSLDATGGGSIWFHAVSVGEVLSSVELLRRVRAEQPHVRLYVSTTTLAGRHTAAQRLAGLADGVFFAPLDYRSIVRRVLRRLRPSLIVILETEIWPNLYREAKRAGASLLIVNGRISDRALPRYRRWSWFFRHALRWPEAIFTQTEEDARRFVAAGAPQQIVHARGNLKYDFKPPAAGVAAPLTEFLKAVAPREVWIAASTMPPADPDDVDEDDVVIDAFRELAARHPALLLILAPRKPERFDAAAEKLARAGIRFTRRSAMEPAPLPGVLLLDSIGELAALFERADVVFMGGTLARRGGHNILEPAYFGKPVIAGPHMENFAAAAEEFTRGGALLRIASPAELAGAVDRLLREPGSIGARARDLAYAKRGATGRITSDLWRFYDLGLPNPMRKLPARIVLRPLSWLWLAGHRVNMARAEASRRRLHAPVLSVGGLTMGGAGKSPMVSWLAARLREAGRVPAVLTRGYKRKSAEPIVIVPRGERASTELTGDEAQIFIQAGDAHVGIGADRYEVGKQMEERLRPDVFILDDGFQHVQLARQTDIVLIDSFDPFGGGVFPYGRARESAHALARADVIVLTRTRPGHPNQALERTIRRYNPKAPVFRSRVEPREWIDVNSTLPVSCEELGRRRVAAFCGLGNPRAFWSTIEELGLEVVFRWAFRDHHSYLPPELQRLALQARGAGAEILVTTEKDALNLCENAASLVAPLKMYWLKIGVEIENEAEFLRLIL
jgi:3-deoxy-D-manno-octulosonic-acid transferase